MEEDPYDILQKFFNENLVNDGYIHQGICCDGCGETIRGRRYKCLSCKDFDICETCKGTKLDEGLLSHDQEHKFYRIQYNHMERPPVDGLDEDQLRLFGSTTSSEDFFTHYPWFISPEIYQQMQPVKENEDEVIFSMFEDNIYIFDSLARMKGNADWKWEQVHIKVVLLVLEQQLVRSRSSRTLWQLFQKLKGIYEESDTFKAEKNDSESYQLGQEASLGSTLQREMRRQIWESGNISSKDWIPILENNIKERKKAMHDGLCNLVTSNQSPLVKQLEHLSLGMVTPEEVPLIAELEDILVTSKYEKEGKSWKRVEYFEKSLEIQKFYIEWNSSLRAEQFEGQENKGYIPVADHAIKNIEPTDLIAQNISGAQQLRRQGYFKEALDTLDRNNENDLMTVFAKFQTYDTMGQLGKALECMEAWKMIEKDMNIIHQLLRVCNAYIRIFTYGEWLDGAQIARETLSWLQTIPLKGIVTSEIYVYTEIYAHRIWLALERDLEKSFVAKERMLERLKTIRNGLMEEKSFCQSWDVLSLELELRKSPWYYHEIGMPEMRHGTMVWNYTNPAEEIHLLEGYLSDLRNRISKGKDADVVTEEGHATLLLAELKLLHGDDIWEADRERAKAVYDITNYQLADPCLKLFDAKRSQKADKSTSPELFDEIGKLFRKHEFLPGIRQAIEAKYNRSITHGSNIISTSPSLDAELCRLSKQAGNRLQYLLEGIRSLGSWLEAPSLIGVCEGAFHPITGFQSLQVGVLASNMLSMTYSIQGNFKDAAANALLHLQLTNRLQQPERTGNAVLRYLKTLYDALLKDKEDQELVCELTNIASVWERWVHKSVQCTFYELQAGKPGTEPALPISEILWLPDVIANAVTEDMIYTMSPSVIDTASASVDLTISFIGLLPPHLRAFHVPEVARALGRLSLYAKNSVLALLSMALWSRAAEATDPHSSAEAKLNIGLQLVKYRNASHEHAYGELFPLTVSTLTEASSFLWEEYESFSSFRSALSGTIGLCSILFDEIKLFVKNTDWDSLEPEEVAALGETDSGKGISIIDMIKAGLDATTIGILGIQRMRKKVVGLSVLHSLESMRYLYSGETEKLYSNHIGFAIEHSRYKGGTEALWNGIQQWKAASLFDVLSRGAEQAETIDPFDWELNTPAGRSIGQDTREILEGRTLSYDDAFDMGEIAEKHLDGKGIIFVDWARCEEFLIALVFNGTTGYSARCPVKCDYSFVESWVEEYIGRFGKPRKRLTKEGPLRLLSALVDFLQDIVEEGDLLVFCPTGVLHSIPLHAIPFTGEDEPLIIRNPVVYCPSLATLQCCISLANETPRTRNDLRAACLSRFGQGDEVEESRIRNCTETVAAKFNTSNIVSGDGLTVETFRRNAKDVDVLHYHGHASLDDANAAMRALVLQKSGEDDGRLTMGDIFSLNLKSSLVTMLACASGEQDMAPNDDPLGIATAFMLAGAATIISTLWPTQTADARRFCDLFYSKAFDSIESAENGIWVGGDIFLTKAFQQTVAELWEEWDGDDPYHWAQFQIHGSWFMSFSDED